MKRNFIIGAIAALAMPVMAQTTEPATVYFTREITPESLVKIYEALGVEAKGKVAIKISTGESQKTGYLRPDFIKGLVDKVDGTIVECNTAYGGSRGDTETHLKTIKAHGFDRIAPVDIMDSEGEMELPMADTTYFKQNLVGSHLANYDFMIDLSHFKGHQMGGFGGALKNLSIGVASSEGKKRIHSAGSYPENPQAFAPKGGQDAFIESMAGAAESVHRYFKGKGDIVYINVMNNMSIDCDCNGNPESPKLKDMGILASTDPVALDRACVDLVLNHDPKEGDDSRPLIARMKKMHGEHIIDHAAKIGMGTDKYKIVELK